MRHIFTVDVEDWYHGFSPDYQVQPPRLPRLEKGMQFLLDALDEANSKATFFWVASQALLYPDLLKECVSRGHEIGSHGLNHTPIFRMTHAEFSRDTSESLAIISDISGNKIVAYRAPYFSITKKTFWALEILASLGIQYDSSILPMRHWRTGMAEIGDDIQIISTSHGPITEVPITTRSFLGLRTPICGGGYFRAYPYNLIKGNINFCNALSKTAVTYFHPWEFDPDHPNVKRNRILDHMHYIGLNTSKNKINRLMQDYSFGPMMEIADEILHQMHRQTEEHCIEFTTEIPKSNRS